MTLRLRPARCPTSRKMGRGGRAQIARDVFVSAERLAEICPSFLNPTAIRKIDGALLHAAILRGGPAEASGPFRVDGIVRFRQHAVASAANRVRLLRVEE